MIHAAVYFVASPLHYLAARRVALDHEAGARQVLVCYRPSLVNMIRREDWDAVVLMPWPRFDPLPGAFGRLRRTLANLSEVARAVGPADSLHLHSPVYDTEAINYFLHALPRLTGAARWRARILPDGLLNLQRHPLSFVKRLAQHVRGLRRLASPLLRYTPFGGDRIGADAPFVDRVYVLDAFPHPYDPAKAIRLAPLVQGAPGRAAPRRALVVGQPLVAVGLLSEAERAIVAERVDEWLAGMGLSEVHYKAHPRESGMGGLRRPRYQSLSIDEPLEAYLAREPYSVVVGCCSTALYTARQICGAGTRIAAFGVEQVRFKTLDARDNALSLMRQLDIELH
ncbi:polysialyltransferase family glycosyltransferase [Ideonella sp. YS5]|uniref:polysialyltransferase family glycosyltransferase n=1 Tax=Ideonella sp. YS5 TaxID=3453714 RepID=UPI003EE91EC1